MLCGMLKASRVAGEPDSYFHRPDQRSWAKGVGLPENAALADILAAVRATAQGGLCGVRLQRHSFGFLMQRLAAYGATDRERLSGALGTIRYIWLQRSDTLAQAVSLLRAQQSGLWHRNVDGSDLERLEPELATGYEPVTISAQIDALGAVNAAWDTWFKAHNIAPHTLTYEELTGDLQLALHGVLELLECDPALAQHVKIPTAQLAGGINYDWMSQYGAAPLAPGDKTG